MKWRNLFSNREVGFPQAEGPTLISREEQESFGKFETQRLMLLKGINTLEALIKSQSGNGSVPEQAIDELRDFRGALGDLWHEFDSSPSVNAKKAEEFLTELILRREKPTFNNDTERGLIILGVTSDLEKIVSKLLYEKTVDSRFAEAEARGLDYYKLFLRADKSNGADKKNKAKTA